MAWQGLEGRDCYGFNFVLPQFTFYSLNPPVSQNALVFGDRALKEVIKVK